MARITNASFDQAVMATEKKYLFRKEGTQEAGHGEHRIGPRLEIATDLLFENIGFDLAELFPHQKLQFPE